jgi:hypothetical protein
MVGSQSRLDDMVAIELGYVIIQWSRLDRVIDEFIEELARLDAPHVSHAITGNLDTKSKIQVAKALAFLRKPGPEWFTMTLSALDTIDNDLRNRRNDVIHAQWITPRGRIHKLTKKTKLKRPQSFQLILETEQRLPVKIKELRLLKKDIEKTWYRLLMLLIYINRPKDGDIYPFQKISFLQYSRQAGLDDRPKRGSSTQIHPPQSSRPSPPPRSSK